MSVKEKLTAVADAIRGKTGTAAPLTLDAMAAEIAGIKTDPVLEELSVSENGVYLPGTEADGFGKVTVAVENSGSASGDEQIKALIDRSVAAFEFPAGLTKIGSYAFYLCGNLEITEIPETVTSIGERAFNGADKIRISRIPDAATYLGRYCFTSPLITEISIPGGVAAEQGAFYTNGLKRVTFRGTAKKLDAGTFFTCNNLTEINVPWAEGEVANAPWGAANATINYNYTEG